MGKKGKKTGKNRQDKFYHLAKEQGYRSRAAFKLIQLNKRHDFLHSASRGVIDLCAAPGGWMQVVRKLIPLHAPCVGVDIVSIKHIPDCIALQEDIRTDSCRVAIKKALIQHREEHQDIPGGILDSELRVDAVISDGSPNMGSAWVQDAYTQSELVLASMKLATEFLAPNGVFLAKVFRSADYNSLLFVANQLFRKVHATKPTASRQESAEIYLVCTGYLAPQKIDPRILDPKVVFKDIGTVPAQLTENQAMHLLISGKVNKKKGAEGYDTSKLLVHNVAGVLDFVEAESPIQLLTTVHALEIPADKMSKTPSELEQLLLDLPSTDEEIREIWKDLRVLGRREFKKLLKWRTGAKKVLDEYQKMAKKAAAGVEGGDMIDSEGQESGSEEEEGEEKEEKEEMNKIRDDLEQRMKRQKKKMNKIRAKNQRRIDMKMVLPDDQLDMPTDEGLFSISKLERLKKKNPTAKIDSDIESDPEFDDIQGGVVKEYPDDSEESDPGSDDDVQAKYNRKLEKQLDSLYNDYVERKGIIRDTKENGDGDQDKNQEGATKDLRMEVLSDEDSDSSSDNDSDAERYRRGRENIHENKLSSEAKMWFSNKAFQEVLAEEEHAEAKVKAEKSKKSKKSPDGTEPRSGKILTKEQQPKVADKPSNPLPFDVSKYTMDDLAEMSAIGKKLVLGGKRSREELEDELYHRNAFDDPVNVPGWFIDDDKANRFKNMPITKEEADEMKLRIQALEALPIKKEAEAKARRKMKQAKRMEIVKGKANQIANQEEMNSATKVRALETLYKNSGVLKKKRAFTGKTYVVASAEGRKQVGKGGRGNRVKYVDKRMLADKRGFAAKNNRQKKKR